MAEDTDSDGKARNTESFLEEKLAHKNMLKRMFDFERLEGQKIAVSMNDGKIYDGIVDSLGNRWGGVVYMKDVDILGSGIKTKHYLPLRIDSMSTWWPIE